MHRDYQITACVQEITATFIHKKTMSAQKYALPSEDCATQTRSKAEKRPQYQFPACAEENDSIFCEYERVIKIYNKYNNAERKKLTATMEQWFVDKAKQCGWADARFYKCDGSTKKACFLVKQPALEPAYAATH
ncbi:hypothetical protein ACN2LU_002936 [Vibrio vulnificus]|nr:hypothetical protein [Vibrio vulnificus]MDF5370817.1 hypothetical protein [Vibrio parahaemolyticus]EHZ2754633.1 hypothetical protein [Vibrio vulnificus]EHZ2763597.1 hypothetical protein [Vibrio vulnificus]EKD8803368.1 hypothetical protein [Vibrio vulnificus]